MSVNTTTSRLNDRSESGRGIIFVPPPPDRINNGTDYEPTSDAECGVF
jgi:hypothetical protein